MTDEDRGMLMLADSLTVMTRKPPPGAVFLLPNADGTYPEGYEASLLATTGTSNPGETDTGSGASASGLDASGLDASGLDASGLDASGLDASGLDASDSIAAQTFAATPDAATPNVGTPSVATQATPDVIPPSEELGTPAFTAEMAQAILTGQEPPPQPPTLIPTADVPDASTIVTENKNETNNFGQNVAQDVSAAAEPAPSAPQNFTPPQPPATASDEPDLLAGFDPSKYLSGGSAMPAPQPPSNTPKTPENTGETAPVASEESAYGDIQEGGGQGGQKDHREAMQMLRELSVLKGN